MMYAKRRNIPIGVSIWMHQDVHIQKATVSSGLMPDTTRYNVFLRRKFYADMLDLSSERHRKIARFNDSKRKFLKKQQHKADTTMPGLLPYIEPFRDDLNEQSRSSINDPFLSSSFQSLTTRSNIKSEATFSPRKPPVNRNKASKYPHRQQMSHEQINQLAQPKGHHTLPPITTTDRIRSNTLKPMIVQDLFDDSDEISDHTSSSSSSSNQPTITTNDKRYRQLVHLFSEVNQRKPSKIQSLHDLIQSNPSLQYATEPEKIKDTFPSYTIEEEDEPDEIFLNDSFVTDSDTDIF